ncbi:MAG: hypothetical protein NXI20_01020 [bacterium]|nr:hypothetical protein [bacterium]
MSFAKRHIVLILFSFLIVSNSYSQRMRNAKAFNTIYAEALGPAIPFSLNYERSFLLKNSNSNFNLRLGATPAGMIFGGSFDIPMRRNYIQLNTNRSLYLGHNADWIDTASSTSFGAAFVIRNPVGFFLSTSLSYVMYHKASAHAETHFDSIILPGIGIGFSFNREYDRKWWRRSRRWDDK